MAEMAVHWKGVHEHVKRPASWAFAGYDISQPFPTFHSAICQPGIFSPSEDFASILNDSGLFDQLENALLHRATADEAHYGAFPFSVLGIWTP
jgi:hypothetical protein